MLDSEKFSIVQKTTYAKFFTELIEMFINLFYSKLRARKNETGYKGSITPSSGEDVKKNQKILSLYKLIYPFTWFVSRLDHLLFFNKGYAHLIIARKEPGRKTDPVVDTHPTF